MADHKVTTVPLDIGNARAYGVGDRVHNDVIKAHFSDTEQYPAGTFVSESSKAAAEVEQPKK